MNQSNPMGTENFFCIEFASSDPKNLKKQFSQLGFCHTASHKKQKINLFQQNNINIFINEERDSYTNQFATRHGPCASAFGILVKNARKAFERALILGAKPFTDKTHWALKNNYAIYGIGNSLLYFVDEQTSTNLFNEFKQLEKAQISNIGLSSIDHLTHNVYRGDMDKWANFYIDLFNFKEIRYFEIKGEKTGLRSRALASPCGNIKIPINESTDNQSQIEEYLKDYHGEGIQHIAFSTNNIYQSVEDLRQNKINFMVVPDTYYEMVESRLPNHGEDLARLQQNRIIIDGNTKQNPKKILLQIFTETMVGPIFYEIIERKGDDGFGEGNFQALFESIERDQIRRGVVK